MHCVKKLFVPIKFAFEQATDFINPAKNNMYCRGDNFVQKTGPYNRLVHLKSGPLKENAPQCSVLLKNHIAVISLIYFIRDIFKLLAYLWKNCQK